MEYPIKSHFLVDYSHLISKISRGLLRVFDFGRSLHRSASFNVKYNMKVNYLKKRKTVDVTRKTRIDGSKNWGILIYVSV